MASRKGSKKSSKKKSAAKKVSKTARFKKKSTGAQLPTRRVAKSATAKTATPKTRTAETSSKSPLVKKPATRRTAPRATGPGALQQFVILPSRGLRAMAPDQQAFFVALNNQLHSPKNVVKSFSMSPQFNPPGIPAPKLKVLDEIDNETSAKLVEMSADDITALRMQDPGARVVPVVYYETCEVPPEKILKKFRPAAAALAANIVVRVVAADSGSPIVGANVVAFTDFDLREGASAVTNNSGKASLALSGPSISIERLYVYPPLGYWGRFKKSLTLHTGQVFKLTPITFPVTDLLEQIHGAGQPADGAGVKVAVLDTGSGPHPDLNVAGGENTVLGEVSTDFHDNGDMHGTHVAGIIAAKGSAPTGRGGVAPGVTLFSYRVFARGQSATNFAIAKAIDRAAQQGCHLINMSLGGGAPDPVISSAIADARVLGCVVIVAAGNDDRQPVSFPANDPRAIAISAMGRKGSFPSDSIDASNVQGPFSTLNAKDFIASFSNIGTKIELTGTGVGIVSTVPGGYEAMSGTSMACPAVVGLAARLLARNPAIMNAAPDQARSDEIIRILFAAAKDVGFPSDLQGQGLSQ